MEESGDFHTPAALLTRKKPPWYPFDRRIGGPQTRYGDYGEEKNLALPGIEPGPFSPVFRLTYPDYRVD
jgi:hypothetical protein